MRNEYIDDLVSNLRSRYATETANMSMSEWIEQNTTIKGKAFSFKEYGFQRTIADDMHPDMDVIKISQVGLTEIQLRKSMGLCVREPGLVGIFTLPDENMFKRLSQGRMNPILSSDKVFAARDGDVRSMNIVQFGQSFLYVGHAVEATATSLSADFLMNDEVDLTDQKILALFSSRLQNSTRRIKQRFSTPTWAGFGIHGGYGASDQREFMCRCQSCNHWQIPQFSGKWVHIPGLDREIDLYELDESIINELPLHQSIVACERCERPLDLDDEANREWVATYPSRLSRRGYRVRPFTTGRLSVEYILTQKIDYDKRDYPRGWVNTVLGEPYADSKSRLSEESIRACMIGEAIPHIADKTDVFVGVDIGMICHVVLGTERGIFEFRTVKINEISDFFIEVMARWNLVSGAVDRHPYTPTADEVRDVTEGRVLPVEYRGEADLKVLFDEEKIKPTHAQANRTRLIDAVVKSIRQRKLMMQGYGPQKTIIIEHLRDMVREESPEKPATWVKLTKVDHYFHALAFYETAKALVGAKQPSGLETRGSVLLGGLPINMGGSLIGGMTGMNGRGLGLTHG